MFVIDFLKWWYLIVLKQYIENSLIANLIYYLNITRALPFVKNFTTPLFRDKSDFGKWISIIIKPWWIVLGSVYSAIRVIPYLIVSIFILILPFIPLIQLIRFLING